MKKIYVACTLEGRHPTKPVGYEQKANEALLVCRKGWPASEWTIFQYNYDVLQDRFSVQAPDSLFFKTLQIELENRYGVKLEREEEKNSPFKQYLR